MILLTGLLAVGLIVGWVFAKLYRRKRESR